jgi:hypothetical protein
MSRGDARLLYQGPHAHMFAWDPDGENDDVTAELVKRFSKFLRQARRKRCCHVLSNNAHDILARHPGHELCGFHLRDGDLWLLCEPTQRTLTALDLSEWLLALLHAFVCQNTDIVPEDELECECHKKRKDLAPCPPPVERVAVTGCSHDFPMPLPEPSRPSSPAQVRPVTGADHDPQPEVVPVPVQPEPAPRPPTPQPVAQLTSQKKKPKASKPRADRTIGGAEDDEEGMCCVQ